MKLRLWGWLAAVVVSGVLTSSAHAQGFDLQCEVSFNMDEFLLGIGHLELTVGYDAADVRLIGSGNAVSCVSLVSDFDGGAVPGEFDDDDVGTLTAALTSARGFSGLTGLALCDLRTAVEPVAEDFVPSVVEAREPDDDPIEPLPDVMVLEISCEPTPTTTTTTTTTSTTTSTTTTSLPSEPTCSDPDGSGGGPLPSDCLFILRVAVNIEQCIPECICAPSGFLPPSPTDALVCLRKSTGQDIELQCPCP